MPWLTLTLAGPGKQYVAAIQTLLIGTRLIMYDGSPFYPYTSSFLDLACAQGVTFFGVSPRYLSTLQSAGIVLNKIPGIGSLQTVTSTGMVLPVSLFRWFYSSSGFPAHVQLANISGGTDMAGALVDNCPILPVYDEVGGCQVASLGVDVRIYDSSVETLDEENPPEGREVEEGQPGDLVCAKAFPNMPVAVWGDEGGGGGAAAAGGPGKKYAKAYFSRLRACGRTVIFCIKILRQARTFCWVGRTGC